MDKQTGKNIIWGWIRLAKIAARLMHQGPEAKAQYSDTFHEASFRIAESRYRQAVRQSETARKKSLRRAKQAITMTYRLYPDLGGPTWRRKYDKLLRRIQKTLGEPDDGIRQLAGPVTPGSSTGVK